MLGYGLVNSEIHKFCLTELINNFFNRTTISKDGIDFFYYLLQGPKKDKLIELSLDGNADALYESDDFYKKYFKAMFEMFLSEEIFFSVKNLLKPLITGYNKEEKMFDNDFGDKDKTEAQAVLYKYILSAILINDKDYPFDATTNAEVISHGTKQLELFFNKLFLLFLKNSHVIIDRMKTMALMATKNGITLLYKGGDDELFEAIAFNTKQIALEVKYDVFNTFLFLVQRRNYLNILDKQIMVLENE
jgi:hypothetical protein